MNKSLKMAAGTIVLTGVLALVLGPLGAGPMPFPDDSAGGNIAAGPMPFPDDSAGGNLTNHAGPMPFPDDSAGGNIVG